MSEIDAIRQELAQVSAERDELIGKVEALANEAHRLGLKADAASHAENSAAAEFLYASRQNERFTSDLAILAEHVRADAEVEGDRLYPWSVSETETNRAAREGYVKGCQAAAEKMRAMYREWV